MSEASCAAEPIYFLQNEKSAAVEFLGRVPVQQSEVAVVAARDASLMRPMTPRFYAGYASYGLERHQEK